MILYCYYRIIKSTNTIEEIYIMRIYQIDGLCYLDPVHVPDDSNAYDIIKAQIIESLRVDLAIMTVDDVMLDVYQKTLHDVYWSKSLNDLQDLFHIFEIVD